MEVTKESRASWPRDQGVEAAIFFSAPGTDKISRGKSWIPESSQTTRDKAEVYRQANTSAAETCAQGRPDLGEHL